MAISALQSLELLERLHAYDGVTPPAKVEEARMYWVGTLIGVAGVSLLVGAGELQEIIETPETTAIPGTKPWVQGVAAFKGGLLPILSGDVLFRNRPYTGRARDYSMVIRRPGLHFGITLSHVGRDLRLPLEDRALDRPVDPDFARFTLGSFRYDGDHIAVLDIDKLVADEDVTNAAAGENSSGKGEAR